MVRMLADNPLSLAIDLLSESSCRVRLASGRFQRVRELPTGCRNESRFRSTRESRVRVQGCWMFLK